jgi:hypothetical protein
MACRERELKEKMRIGLRSAGPVGMNALDISAAVSSMAQDLMVHPYRQRNENLLLELYRSLGADDAVG